MNSLLEMTDRHPALTGLVGAASGLGSYVLSVLHDIAGIAADVGILFGCAASALTVGLLLHRWRHRGEWNCPLIEQGREHERPDAGCRPPDRPII